MNILAKKIKIYYISFFIKKSLMETLKLFRCFIVVKNEGKLFQSLDAKKQNDFEPEPFTLCYGHK